LAQVNEQNPDKIAVVESLALPARRGGSEVEWVDDVIRRLPRPPLRRESLSLANVTREAGRVIGNGAMG
jgi:hypothetical protein